MAKLGQVVEVAGGRYPGEMMRGAKSADLELADDVVFRPAPGARVEVAGKLEVYVPHVEFRDMAIAKWKARYDARDPKNYAAGDITMRNIDTHHFALTSVRHVRVLGGDVGPNRNPQTGDWPQDGIYVGAWPKDSHVPADIVFDGIKVHDVTKPDSNAHSDCIQFTAGIDVTIRNSRFDRCEHVNIIVKGDQGPIDGFLIENNFFGDTLSGHRSIDLYETSRGCRNVVVRHNSALQNIRSDSCTGATITGNIQQSMSSYHCSKAKARLDWNLYEAGSRCGRNDRVGNPAYVSRARLDLRLGVGSAAINAADPGSHPRTDIQGRRRPVGRAPDAGAFERPVRPQTDDRRARAGLVLRPSPPRAGRRFAATLVVDAPGWAPKSLRCAASIGATRAPLVGRRTAQGRSTCTWKVPVRAGGRVLRGWIEARSSGKLARRDFALRVLPRQAPASAEG